LPDYHNDCVDIAHGARHRQALLGRYSLSINQAIHQYKSSADHAPHGLLQPFVPVHVFYPCAKIVAIAIDTPSACVWLH